MLILIDIIFCKGYNLLDFVLVKFLVVFGLKILERLVIVVRLLFEIYICIEDILVFFVYIWGNV